MPNRSLRFIFKSTVQRQFRSACRLLALPKSRKVFTEADQQAAALMMFMSGVDKALSLACILLYLAGKVDDGWLKPPHDGNDAGFIGCGNGLTAKMNKLIELGALKSDVGEFVKSRNRYVHQAMLRVGYFECAGEVELASLTQIDHGLPGVMRVTSKQLRDIGKRMIDELTDYLDNHTTASDVLGQVWCYIDGLPPIPDDLRQTLRRQSRKRAAWIRETNAKLIGPQWRNMLATLRHL